jgi:cytochrome c biogenesis protein CcmG/thiol:disulfide interchange protein DsbE
MKSVLTILPLAALILLASVFGFFALQKSSTRVEPDFTVGKPAPEIMAPFLEGGPPVALSEQIKGPALVNLFASWCAPCVVENPYLLELESRGVRIVGLAQRDEPADTAQFLNRWGDPFAVILDDRDERGMIDFGATAVPETFVVDSSGVIVFKHTGPIENEAQMEEMYAAVQAAE